MGAFCGKALPVRKGREGKTPAYDYLVTENAHFVRRAAGAFLLVSSCAVGTGAVPPAPSPASDSTVPLEIRGSALGAGLEMQVRDLPRQAGEQALNAAWDAVMRAERELDALAAAAARGSLPKQPMPEELLDLLVRAQSFCTWSDGAAGPAGGAVYRLWAQAARSGALPTPDQLEAAAATTPCTRVTLEPEGRTLALAPGSELDLRGFARGWAVDLAIRTLTGAGATNARVTLGAVIRGMGAGPTGAGWPVPLPKLSASGDPQNEVLLVNEALAVSNPAADAIEIAGEPISPAFDLRTGKPGTGVSSVVTVTPLAADAEPLAMAMSVLGANGGQMRLGTLQPKPAVLWLLGAGETAVVASSNWSAVHRP